MVAKVQVLSCGAVQCYVRIPMAQRSMLPPSYRWSEDGGSMVTYHNIIWCHNPELVSSQLWKPQILHLCVLFKLVSSDLFLFGVTTQNNPM